MAVSSILRVIFCLRPITWSNFKKKWRYPFAGITLFLTHLATLHAAMTPAEEQLQSMVKAHTAQRIALLRQLVSINSGTTNLAGVYAVGKIVEQALSELGFTTRWVQEPPSMQRAATLIAYHAGTRGKKLILIGHLDTVFSADSPFQQFTLKQHSAKGPGTLDDKGGLVVMLSALSALKSVGSLKDADITVVLTGDEEDSGKPSAISRLPLKEAAAGKDIALDFEPSVSAGTVSIARRGISNWLISASGNESHSATIFKPGVGDGAIFEVARILNTLRHYYAPEADLSFNPGLIAGGGAIYVEADSLRVSGKNNVVAKRALVKGDFRYLSLQQKAAFEKHLQMIVRHHLKGTQASVEFIDGIPALPPNQNSMQLLNLYSRASADLGYGTVKPLPAGMRGAGDISHLADIVPAKLIGLGPLGLGSHAVIETVELASLTMQTERAALLLQRLLITKNLIQ